MIEPLRIRFQGAYAQLVFVTDVADLDRVVRTMGLHFPCPVVVLIGGAAGLDADQVQPLRELFRALARAAEETGAAVLDGGTEAGVMRLMGRARMEVGGSFPLIGVAVEGTVLLPAEKPRVLELRERYEDKAPLEPNHTHFVLVPGKRWGDESLWIAEVARVLAGNAGSVTVLVNGGEIARQDVAHSLAAGRPVVAVAGTGRLADELASARERPSLVHVVHLAAGPQAVAPVVTSLLKESRGGQV